MDRVIFSILIVALAPALAEAPAWVEKSNRNAQVLLEIDARYNPESAGHYGMSGLDERIVDMKPGARERQAGELRSAEKTLQSRLGQERDPLVRQDLEILIDAASQQVRAFELREKYYIPYTNAARVIYNGIQALLDDQIAAARRPAALARLRKYTGLERGYTPLATLAEARTREKLARPGLLGPATAEVEKDLSNTQFFFDGIGQLFEKYEIAGYQEPYAKLKEQMAAYDVFVRKDVLPKSRADFRLPAELYEFNLKRYGVDIPAAELTAMAHAAFTRVQDETQTMAAKVAADRGWSAKDYRDVIRQLKKEQLLGEQILPFYRKRIAGIEEIVRREKLVTLPDRPTRMSIASAAETAAQPAPHMNPPRLIGNQGESGEFILPLNVPGPAGAKRYDDFSFEAASWTLASHEARPGHEMQFAAMVEKGVSQARAIYAFNSVNVEGWGLYAERIMRPYMPADGQLISLRDLLLRAARAFLDPELHSGKITPDQARRFLLDEVVLSEALTEQEVERYMFRSPAQATSYFYGYTRLNELRADVERALGANFDQRKFHDFILSQGLLPPALLRKAVLAEFAISGSPTGTPARTGR